MNKMLLAAAAATAMMSSAAFAAVIFDPLTGNGFVGKGDVQYTYGYNNKTMNEVAPRIGFRASSESISEVSWDCINERNEQIQERTRTTTTSTQGVVTTMVRDNKTKQVTGFNLAGYDGSETTTTAVDGPPLHSCPNANSSFVLGSTTETVLSEGASVLEVTNNGSVWTELLTPSI